MRQYIVDQININRNIIASGGNPNLTGALNMPKVVGYKYKNINSFDRFIYFLSIKFYFQSYDYELEKMATFKAQLCKFATHDECRNTCKQSSLF